MSIEPITALGAEAASAVTLAPPPTRADSPAFAGLLEQFGSLNARMQAGDAALQSVALGNAAELHRVLMDLESTRLSFDLMLQVRNRVLDAYQELMRLQI
jgi:flagellar hook-basal body complex protein FliE